MRRRPRYDDDASVINVTPKMAEDRRDILSWMQGKSECMVLKAPVFEGASIDILCDDRIDDVSNELSNIFNVDISFTEGERRTLQNYVVNRNFEREITYERYPR